MNDSRCDFEAKPFVCEEYRDPRPDCGDGQVQEGEACDTRGATADCDADCSPVVCGDGLVNAASGEVCDDAGQRVYCSSDCRQYLCPAGCTCFASGGGNYALCTTPASFRDAAVNCGHYGMALAHVDASAEDQALRTRATNQSVIEYWVGGADLDAEGQWMWLDATRFWNGAASGTALGYAHFAAGAPGGGTASNCLRVAADGKWKDADCAKTAPYVCERIAP